VEYDPPLVIFDQLDASEKEIQANLKELRGSVFGRSQVDSRNVFFLNVANLPLVPQSYSRAPVACVFSDSLRQSPA
jgi:hypothetical protein